MTGRSTRPADPVFLGLDDVLALHAHQLERYGGSPGVRDLALLQSALAMPAATFSGEYLHAVPFEMAAAYLFHITKNHPFVDGNKRVGLASALAFLGLNGWRIHATEDEVVALVVGIASGAHGKADAAVFLRQHARKR